MPYAMWKPEYNFTRKTDGGRANKSTATRRWRAHADRNVLAGLTQRGTIPKRRLNGRLMLADVDALAAAIAQDFETMTPAVKAKMLVLEIKLATIRKQLI